MSNLIIVESPTKAKTISKFLGKKYKILSSYGHVRDLPKSKLGVDTENGFQPSYVIPTRSRKHVNLLKKAAADADIVYFATDEDREGEAQVDLRRVRRNAGAFRRGRAVRSRVPRPVFDSLRSSAPLKANVPGPASSQKE